MYFSCACLDVLLVCILWVFATGWRRLVGSPKLHIIFHKRATRYRSLLWKMTYKDKGSYGSSPPCALYTTHESARRKRALSKRQYSAKETYNLRAENDLAASWLGKVLCLHKTLPTSCVYTRLYPHTVFTQDSTHILWCNISAHAVIYCDVINNIAQICWGHHIRSQ